MKTFCFSSECNRSHLQGMCVGEVVVLDEKLMQSSDPRSVFHISGKSPTLTVAASKGLHPWMGLSEMWFLTFMTTDVEFPVWGNYKEPESHHVGSQVNVSAWRICLCFILFAWLQRCLSHDAFQKSCQQQISVNVIHYSVITNCGLHKSAYYFVIVQRSVFLASKALEGCKERKEERLGQTEDTLERSHFSTDQGKF